MTAVSAEPMRGTRFPTLEKYDVLEELGHGGMATVYRARDLRLGRDVAVKVIHPHLRDKPEAVRRFSIEARAVAKLHHPNIVEVFDVSSAEENEQYLVVELLRGVTLRQLLEKHTLLPPEVAASLAVELLSAVAHAHEQGVIHRDVKPENVILEHRPPRLPGDGEAISHPDGPGERIAIKLMDFGIAKLLDAQGVTSTGQVLGSPAHMAPEQIEGREVDGRADVFGLGVLTYECMVGHLPFQGTNPAQVLRRVLEGEYPSAERERGTVGQAWSRILDRALASEVDARFASAPQMRDVLLRELSRLGVSSPRGEIEAWLDDPAAFSAKKDQEMPKALCATASLAAERGEAVLAASDYNRALAYAPHDPSLLKIVARMNRRSSRRAFVRKGAPYLALSVVVLGGAGAALGVVRARKITPLAQVPTQTSSSPPSAPLPVTQSLPSAEPVNSARVVARPTVGPSAASRPVVAKSQSREVHFASVEPSQGVLVAIDGSPPIALDATRGITVDEKAHNLTFSCTADLCDTVVRSVEASDRPPSPLSIHLSIKPSKLVIRGNPGNHYALSDDPTHTYQSSDFANPVPMTQSAQRTVVVKEIETGDKRTVLLTTGRTAEVRFSPP